MHQTTCSNEFIDTTIFESSANGICPFHQSLREFGILTTKLLHQIIDNLQFGFGSRIILIECDSKTLEECFIQNVSTNIPTIIATLAFGVSSGKDIESSSGSDNLILQLEVEWFAFQNRLQTQQSICTTSIDFIEQKGCASTHSNQDWTFYNLHVTIDQRLRTDQLLFIRHHIQINTDEILLVVSTHLLNHS